MKRFDLNLTHCIYSMLNWINSQFNTTSILLLFKIQWLLCIYLLNIRYFYVRLYLPQKHVYFELGSRLKHACVVIWQLSTERPLHLSKLELKRVFLWIRDLFPMSHVKLFKEWPFFPTSSRKMFFLNPVSKFMELSCICVWFGFGTLYRT